MKKALILIFLKLSILSFALSFDEEDKVILRQEQRLVQERLEREFKNRKESSRNLKFEEIEENVNEDEIKFQILNIVLKDDEKLLNEIEKERILTKYLGKDLGSTDITNLLAELTNRLITKGYITTVASISQDNDLTTKQFYKRIKGKKRLRNIKDSKRENRVFSGSHNRSFK